MNFTWSRQGKFLLVTAFILIISGYMLMFYKDNNIQELNEEIFNFRRITLAPVTVVLGYLCIVLAIMKK